MATHVFHVTHEALELEFYIPAAVWEHDATQKFLTGVYSLVEGATLVGGVNGVWKGQVETTHLVRIIVHKERVHVEQVLAQVRAAVEHMMHAWALGNDRQTAFMFTSRSLTVFEARL